jgi:hypothetical protein
LPNKRNQKIDKGNEVIKGVEKHRRGEEQLPGKRKGGERWKAKEGRERT